VIYNPIGRHCNASDSQAPYTKTRILHFTFILEPYVFDFIDILSLEPLRWSHRAFLGSRPCLFVLECSQMTYLCVRSWSSYWILSIQSDTEVSGHDSRQKGTLLFAGLQVRQKTTRRILQRKYWIFQVSTKNSFSMNPMGFTVDGLCTQVVNGVALEQADPLV
jgi:hypothetical protein